MTERNRTPADDSADRRFYSWPSIVFGPLFVLGGFLAAFTVVGALLIWAGMSLLLAGILLRTRLASWVAGSAALALFCLLTAYTLVVYPG